MSAALADVTIAIVEVSGIENSPGLGVELQECRRLGVPTLLAVSSKAPTPGVLHFLRRWAPEIPEQLPQDGSVIVVPQGEAQAGWPIAMFVYTTAPTFREAAPSVLRIRSAVANLCRHARRRT